MSVKAADTVLYRHAGGAMLRAAVLSLPDTPAAWPSLVDSEACRLWLAEVWRLPDFADAVRYSSNSFAAQVDAVLDHRTTSGKQIRRVTLSVMRYVLRSVGRPTPFGLFAGVAAVDIGRLAQVVWGGDHRAMIRADTLWLDDVVEQLEAIPGLLRHLDVLFCDLVTDRGDRIEMPRGPGRVTVRNTALVRLVHDAAALPILFRGLASKIAEAFPDVPSATITGALDSLVKQGVLITNLRAPMTIVDPLAYVIKVLDRTPFGEDAGTVHPLADRLREIQRILQSHNTVDIPQTILLRGVADELMRRVSTAGRTAVAGDLHLDCRVTVPADVAREMASAVTALLRLTRQPRPDPSWNDWCREFWDRYGTGTIVPVTEAVHPDAGIGLPAGFAGSVLTEPQDNVSRRDQTLLRLAWEAVATGKLEVELTEDMIDAIASDAPIDPRWIPAHVELGARVFAHSEQALSSGDYTFAVHPAWAFGTLTGRFGKMVTQAGLDTVFAATPPVVDEALSAQLTFPPLFPHSENVARIPAYLPHVLSLGEHRGDDPTVIRLDDLGIVAVADGLHLISISRRRIIEPQVFHALALQKQAPPLARFLATLTRGFLARYTELDWGPHAAQLPYLPRVRYRRAILAPATWRITTADRDAMTADGTGWDESLTAWRESWHCPDTVEVHDDHRSLRLTLTVDAHVALLNEHLDKHGYATLTETESAADVAWIGGHVHEIVMPFVRTIAATPNLITGDLPVVRNTAPAHRPAAPQASWLFAQVFTHPERLDEIIGTHLPRLLTDLGGDAVYWFARYRSVRETDHLRLRIYTEGPTHYAAVAAAVGLWGQQLCEAGAASRLSFATYHPEIGRYGRGPAMEAAEAVFAADSHAVTLAARLLPARTVHPIALTAMGLLDIVDGFHSDPLLAADWLIEHLAAKPATSAERAVADQVVGWASRGHFPDGTGLPPAVAHAWRSRTSALRHYREALTDDTNHHAVLSALLHMHHNRARRIDRVDEATCLRLARQAALARRVRTAERRS